MPRRVMVSTLLFSVLALSGCAGELSAPGAPPPAPPPEIVASPVAFRDTDPNRVAIPHADGPGGIRFADFFGDLAVAAVDFDVPPPPAETPLTFSDTLYRVLRGNPDLMVARHIPEQARAGVDGARAVYDPEAFAEWSRAEDQDDRMGLSPFRRDSVVTTERVGLRQRLPTGGQVSAYREWIDGTERGGGFSDDHVRGASHVVEMRQPLLQGFMDRENRTRIQIARLQVDLSDEEFAGTVSDSVATASDAYWQFAGAREEIRIAREVLAKAREVLERENARRDEGLLMDLDVERASEAVEARRADLLRAEENIAVLRERMGFMLGLEPGAMENLVPAEAISTPPFTVDVDQAIREAAAKRSEVKAAELRMRQSERKRAYARHQRLPKLDAVGSVRDNFPRRTGSVGGDSRDLTGTDWNVGLQFSMPLGMMEARAAMRQANAEIQQRQAEWFRARQQAVAEARMAAKQIDICRREIPTALRAVEAARKVIEGEEARWEINQVGNQDLLRAHDLLAAAERNHLQAQLRYNTALIRFFHAQGTLLERVGVQVAPPSARARYSDLWRK